MAKPRFPHALTLLFGYVVIAAALSYVLPAGQYDLLTPTNGALMAILATSGVQYEHWVKFAFSLYAVCSRWECWPSGRPSPLGFSDSERTPMCSRALRCYSRWRVIIANLPILKP